MLTNFFRMTSKYKLTDKPQSNYAQVARFYILNKKDIFSPYHIVW